MSSESGCAWRGVAAIAVGLLVAACVTEGAEDVVVQSPAPATPAAVLEPTPEPGPPSSERTLRQVHTITGEIAPKSVVASGAGLFFAQNMMYRHTVTVYDRTYRLVATIPDSVDLAAFGIHGYVDTVRGAPVEAAFTSDGGYAWVSNYSMYGPGFDNPGSDTCSPDDGIDDSFVYRIDTVGLRIDGVARVGAVPKYLAVTPDDLLVVVANWCSYDVSILDAESMREVGRVEVGRYPRGIAVDAASEIAYIAVMGSTRVAKLDLRDHTITWIENVGLTPRHLVLDPQGRYLYATLNQEGRVVKIDLVDGAVVADVATGQAPRSMAIAQDGLSLYVVNYHDDTVTKVRTSDMAVLQEVSVAERPIGITYDAGEVWVASYTGVITVFLDGA
jgi:YVTN family beta-propeller protein